MKTVIFKGVGKPLAIEDRPDPTPGEGEMVVRVGRCGVCGTDLHGTEGHGYTYPENSQFGHEYGGEIVALGKGVERFKIGDKIAAMPVVGCGHCDGCKTGIDLLCKNIKGYGEGLAQYARVNARGATLLPQTVSLADGALVEPLAVGRRGVRLSAPKPDQRMLVIGPGPIGLAVLFWLRQAGVRNITVLASSTRRQQLAEKMGAEAFVVEGENAPQQVTESLGGEPDVVFECAGMPGVVARSIELVKPGGLVTALGFCQSPESIVPAYALLKDITLRWSTIYTRDDYADCARALDKDADRARAMVTDTVDFAHFPEAFETLRAGKTGGGKLLIDPWA